MKRIIPVFLILALVVGIFSNAAYAGSDKTWSGIGKGLAIYEGFKVLTGRQGNIVDDVTGGMKPRESSNSSASSTEGSYEDGYNAGFKQGYEQGYNAGFRYGVEQNQK